MDKILGAAGAFLLFFTFIDWNAISNAAPTWATPITLPILLIVLGIIFLLPAFSKTSKKIYR